LSEPASVDPGNGEVVDFQVVREDWSRYKLADGVTLKTRLVVTKVIRTEQHDPTTGEPTYVFSSTTLMSTICPKAVRGRPTVQPLTPQLVQQSIAEVVDFESEDQDGKWNVYNFSDGTILRIKLEVTKVSRTSLCEETGDPVYFVSSQNVVRFTSPRNLFNKRASAAAHYPAEIYK
jgi:hypothetical protein